METLENLKAQGETLGYEGDALRAFIKDQQDRLRDERKAQREAQARERELAAARELKERELAEAKAEAKAAHEREIQRMQLQQDIEQKKHIFEMERLAAEQNIKPAVQHKEDKTYVTAKTPKIPAFDEGKDEMDSYLLRFERYATAQKWKKEDWATNLSALLKGKALDVYALMPIEEALNYDMLKAALLKRYELTEEGFKRRYKKCRPDSGETFQQFTSPMKSYFTRWVDMSGINKTYDGLADLILRDQLAFICNRDLELFLREREPKSLEQASKLADQYKEARYTDILNLTFKINERPRSRSRSRSPSPSVRRYNHQGPQPFRGSCFICGDKKHIARFCPDRAKGNMKVAATRTYGRGRSRSPSKHVRFQDQRQGQELSDNEKSDDNQVCGACFIHTDTVSYVQASNVGTKVCPGMEDTLKVSTTAQPSPICNDMKTVQGIMGNQIVSVLRDTGCTGVIVKQSLVSSENLTGKMHSCMMVDRTTLQLPEAKVSLDTPYFKGDTLALCMENPLVDVIIGNIPGARDAYDPNINWVPALAVQTRSQAKLPKQTKTSLKTPNIIDRDISPQQIKEAQVNDPTLARIRKACDESEVKGNAKFFRKNDLIYRQFSSPNVEFGKIFIQLVVPQQYRKMVMKLAHESILSGHLAVKRTIQKVLSEFFWPGIASDIKRFCQSCDICQRTIAKGRNTRAPLGSMPVIDTPFQRVAIDLVGPLEPRTENRNKYILTLVDYATRYPEAVALSSIETEAVAEALVCIFSRVGVPKEILTDMGSQFTSALMKEVSRLLSFKQLVTSPYHPICNGLVERFNGTLKKMLTRMCAERPKDWDKYIDPLLFAYREVPQESLGFSPFELIYGWPVRGPMQVLRELWTKDIEDPRVRTTYQYVLDLRERLESTVSLAQQNLQNMSKKYKKYYNRKSRRRHLKVGNKVLVLLPTKTNKLLMSWKGPYEVVEKLSVLDYRIKMGKKVKTFHINMLRQYIEREDDQQTTDVQVCSIAVLDCTSEDNEDNIEGLVESPSICDNESVELLNINPDLTKEEQSQVRQLVTNFASTFTGIPGCTTLLEHDIKLTTDTPVRVKQYPLPFNMMEAAKDEVRDMINLDIVEPSESPYCSPVLIVKKKDNTNRFCIDFRTLNKITVFDAEPMPNMEEIFTKIAGHKYISKLDLTKGYWQIPLTKNAKQYTAFQTPLGLLQFKVLPFGLVTAQASCSKLMRKLLKGMSNIDNFVDDIIIFTSTWEHHMQVFEELLKRLRDANLTVKPSKCFVGFQNLECLGHLVGGTLIRPCPDKILAIEKAERPVTKKQVRSFLGLVGFYRSFIPNFSHIAAPLTELTKKGESNKVHWDEPQQRAFDSLKALTVQPILKMADLSKPFTLQVDASNEGLGAVLLQDEEGKKSPIAYASRKLKPSEKSYAVIEKECLALVWAVQKFHRYLYGTAFTIETDHQPLSYLNKAKLTNSRLMRWALALQPYRFHIVAIRGAENVGADYLSRV